VVAIAESPEGACQVGAPGLITADINIIAGGAQVRKWWGWNSCQGIVKARRTRRCEHEGAVLRVQRARFDRG